MNLDNYLQVSEKHYNDIFDTVEHENIIDGIDVNLHFKYLKFDPNGNLKIDLLVNTLLNYATHYCFSSQKRDVEDDEFEKK